MKRVDNNEYCVYHNDCGAWDGPNSRTVDMIYAVCNMIEKRESSIALKSKYKDKIYGSHWKHSLVKTIL